MSNSPFQWTKQVASHYGGTRNPLVVHWPNGIRSSGEIRSQWHHVTDVAPTVKATPVTEEYAQGDNEFSGTIEQVTIELL